MEIAEDFPDDMVVGDNLNFIYLKNELNKLLNY